MKRIHGALAEFDTPDALLKAATRIREAGFTRWDTYTPYPVHGIDGAMGVRYTKLPWLVFGFGLVGCLGGLLLTGWTNGSDPDDWQWLPIWLQGYDFQISGKPPMSLPAFIPVIFELTILFAAIGAVVGMLALNNLPWFYNPLLAQVRFRRASNDRFFAAIEARDPKFKQQQTARFLESLDATAVEQVEEDEERDDSRLPVFLRRAGVAIAIAALIPPMIVAKNRNSTFSGQKIHIVQDMDNQPRFKAQQANRLFADDRAMRLPVGYASDRPQGTTVARGELREDDHYWRGVAEGDYAQTFPAQHPDVELTDAFLRRGQERFNIYCSVCHGYNGAGVGAVRVAMEQRNRLLAVKSLYDPEVLKRPPGHIFNTITNGIRTMPAYGSQIPPTDRWAIVAYVKTLQRAHQGSLDDLTPEQRMELSRTAEKD